MNDYEYIQEQNRIRHDRAEKEQRKKEDKKLKFTEYINQCRINKDEKMKELSRRKELTYQIKERCKFMPLDTLEKALEVLR